MIAPHTRRDRAAEGASHADRLKADLVNLSEVLEQHRDLGDVLEILRNRSLSLQRQLQAIARRVDALGSFADPGKYPLSDKEHEVLMAASDLREEMIGVLARVQRGELEASSPRKF